MHHSLRSRSPLLLRLTQRALHHPRRVCLAALAAAALSSAVYAQVNAPVAVKDGMHALLSPLRDLQPFIVDQGRFSDPANRTKILELMQALRSNFHSLEQLPSQYRTLPGFQQNLVQVSELLDDTTRRFEEGKVSYAWWRNRTLPASCFACHATYKVSSNYSDSAVVAPSLSSLDRARFLLATRQFRAAQEELLKALRDPAFRYSYDEALRSLLVVVTRVNKEPSEGIALFKRVLATSKLPEEDVRDVQRWIAALKRWQQERKQTQPSQPAQSNPLAAGEALINAGTARGLEYQQDDVSLLRGTALVHTALEQVGVSPDDRRRGLYLLGMAYSSLQLYFAEGWAGMYLEQCITEFPNTTDAQAAYRLYRDQIVDLFTGSGGTNIPAEVTLHLEDLRKAAYGEASFTGRI